MLPSTVCRISNHLNHAYLWTSMSFINNEEPEMGCFTFLISLSLSLGRVQVALKRAVTCLSFNFLVYLWPAEILQSCRRQDNNSEKWWKENGNLVLKKNKKSNLHWHVYRLCITPCLYGRQTWIFQFNAVFCTEILHHWCLGFLIIKSKPVP